MGNLLVVKLKNRQYSHLRWMIMSALRILGTVNPSSFSSRRNTSQPTSLSRPHFAFPVAKTFLGLIGVPSIAATLHPAQLLGTAESCMAETGSSGVNPPYAEIFVVRHGETEWNVDGRIQGHLDVELNDAGRQQATAVAGRLSREPNISAIYSSDLKRAFETAQTIATSCGGLEVLKEPDLRERHLGDLQGLVLREAAKLSPKAYEAFLNHKADQEIPGGGESLDQLYERCTSSLERIGRKHQGERVVVVTHGGVIRSLYNKACPNGRSGGKVLNTSVNIFHLSDRDEWTIASWGDISHLNQTGFLKSGFGGNRASG